MAKKSKKNLFEVNDVLLLSNGRMVQMVGPLSQDITGYSLVQYVEQNDLSWLDEKNLDVQKNLGSSDSILAIFAATRTIHLRLNNINRV